jgi:hypothetical protein
MTWGHHRRLIPILALPFVLPVPRSGAGQGRPGVEADQD